MLARKKYTSVKDKNSKFLAYVSYCYRCLILIFFFYRAESPLALLYGTSTMEHHHFDHCIMILNSEVRLIFKKDQNINLIAFLLLKVHKQTKAGMNQHLLTHKHYEYGCSSEVPQPPLHTKEGSTIIRSTCPNKRVQHFIALHAHLIQLLKILNQTNCGCSKLFVLYFAVCVDIILCDDGRAVLDHFRAKELFFCEIHCKISWLPWGEALFLAYTNSIFALGLSKIHCNWSNDSGWLKNRILT